MSALTVQGLEVTAGGASVGVELLEVAAGEIIAVVGPAGSGKTVLRLGLAGLLPCVGAVTVDGCPLDGMAPHLRVGKGLAQVPAHGVELPELLVGELLDLPGRRRGGRRWAGRGTGRRDATPPPGPGRPWSLHDLAELLPGLSRAFDAGYGTLAAWERSAVSLALALRTGPRVVVLDEPTAGLGERSQGRLQVCLRRIADSGVAVLVLTRQAGFARATADRCLVLRRGRLDGPLSQPAAIAAPYAAGAPGPPPGPGVEP